MDRRKQELEGPEEGGRDGPFLEMLSSTRRREGCGQKEGGA